MDHELLTAADEAALARGIEAGLIAQEALSRGVRPHGATRAELHRIVHLGVESWDRFLLANTGLVRTIAAAEAMRTGLDEEDLVQEGFVALAAALQRFDYQRGRFSTYAVPRIRYQVALAASSRLGSLGLPPSVAVLRRRALAVAGRLDQQRRRYAGARDVSDEIGRSATWTSRILGHATPLPLQDGRGVSREGAPPPKAELDPLDANHMSLCLAQLPPVERDVLRLRFGFTGDRPLSYAAAASRLGMSASGVRRVEQRGLATLRRHLRAA